MQSDKAKIRSEALAARLKLSEDVRKKAERQILIHVCEVLSHLKVPQIISGYAPFRGEVNCLQILTALYQQGYETGLPVVRAGCENEALEFRAYHPDQKLLEGFSSIMEPDEDQHAIHPHIMLVPLLAFNNKLHRIGYGAGHYDRTIKHMKDSGHKVFTIGLAFELQKFDNFHSEAHDQRLDRIVTEDKIYSLAG